MKILSALLLISPSLMIAMASSPLHTYTVPGEKGSPGIKVTAEQLRAIKSEKQLQSYGTLKSIVVRPEANKRTMVPSALITKQGLVGDKGPRPDFKYPHLVAIALMRSDVSDVLGGAHILGDNLHVDGISLSTETLHPGDVIIITEPDNKQKIKVSGLMTETPHTACARLEARVGTTAFRFINGIGEFEEAKNMLTAQDGQPLNGPQQRLRGVFLTVLEEGIPSVNDLVFILTGQQKDEYIAKLGMSEFCKKALEESIIAKESLRVKEEMKRKTHRNAYLSEKAKAEAK